MSSIQQLLAAGGVAKGWKLLAAPFDDVLGEISVSDSGQRLIAAVTGYSPAYAAVRNFLAYSHDYGATWSIPSTSGRGPNGTFYSPISASSDGLIVYAKEQSEPHTSGARSLDGGITWSNITLPSGARNIQCAGNGTTVWAGNSNGGQLFKSTDSGANWTTVSVTGSGAEQFPFVGVSRDGTKLAVFENQTVYLSVDSGGTWTSVPSVTPVYYSSYQIRISDDGSKILIGLGSGSPYDVLLSTNGGTSFTALTLGSAPQRCSMSADGRVMAVSGSSTGGIYLSLDYGASWAVSEPQGSPGNSLYVVSTAAGKIITHLIDYGLDTRSRLYTFED